MDMYQKCLQAYRSNVGSLQDIVTIEEFENRLSLGFKAFALEFYRQLTNRQIEVLCVNTTYSSSNIHCSLSISIEKAIRHIEFQIPIIENRCSYDPFDKFVNKMNEAYNSILKEIYNIQ